MSYATVTAVFNCSRDRAFKTPILGDATKFLTGYLLQPAVLRFEDDKTWGQVNGIRYPVAKGNFLVPETRVFTDEVLERRENEYWRWTIYDFTIPVMFFAERAVGEWEVTEHPSGGWHIRYTYTFTASHPIWRPLLWLFVNIQWKGMMQKAIKGIQQQAESEAPYIYNP